jgi:menaquinone-specific isochorismate synthase
MSVIDLVDRLHPTAAVGGTPTEKAVELIRRLEGMERGRYTGPVGWTNAAGDGEWAIALRCAELSGARARLFAGSGIVAGSLPESELEETRLKLTTMMNALES